VELILFQDSENIRALLKDTFITGREELFLLENWQIEEHYKLFVFSEQKSRVYSTIMRAFKNKFLPRNYMYVKCYSLIERACQRLSGTSK